MRVLVEHSISRRMCSSNIKEKVEMFHPVNLTCNLCCFTAAKHVQWGNHIIYNHSNIFLPVFPSYESFNDPYLQYQYFHQIQSLLIRPTFNFLFERKPEVVVYQHERKENEIVQLLNFPQKSEVVSNQPGLYQKQVPLVPRPLQQQDALIDNSYNNVMGQFQKGFFCQYLRNQIYKTFF